jgi:hypothetical protein
MHDHFRFGFEKRAQSPEEQAFARGVITGYQQAHAELEEEAMAGDPMMGGQEEDPQNLPEPPPSAPNQASLTANQQGAASGNGPTPLAQSAANPQTQAGQSGIPNDAAQSNPLQPSPPPERRAPNLAPTAAQANSPERGKVAPIPQRAQRDYGEQFAGPQSPYSANY